MKVNDPVQVEKNGTDYEGNVTEIGSMVNPQPACMTQRHL